MKIGGYQIINLKGKNLTTDVGMVYDGLYELIEGTRKPILLSGIQIDDTEYQDVFAEVSVNGSNIELRAYGKVFTVQDNNVVTVTDDENGGGGGGDTPTDEYVNFKIVVKTFEDDVLKTYNCKAPVNTTWRNAIFNDLIEVVSVDTVQELSFLLGIGDGKHQCALGYHLGVASSYILSGQDEAVESALYIKDEGSSIDGNDIITNTDYTNVFLV